MNYIDVIPYGDIKQIRNITGKPKSLSEIERLYPDADIIINTAIFRMSTGEIEGKVTAEGKSTGDSYYTYGIAFPNDAQPVKSLDNKEGYAEYIGPYSQLVTDGKADDTLHDTSKRGRTAIGLTKAGLALCVISDDDMMKCSTRALASLMISLDCDYAINLDGGGSSQGKFPNGKRYASTRKVPAWLVIWLRKEERKMKIAIDCGHTESTAGKRSPDGTLREYEFNRDVGKRLQKHLERHGVETLLIAPSGEDDLMERCRKANEWKADYFISIHANAFESTWNTANGWSIFVVSRGGQAEKLAKAIYAESVPYLGLKDRIKSQGDGKILAEPFIVLKHTDMPAVLVEHGFYTNLQECERLKTSEFREMCAIADAKGILKYIGIEWKEQKDERKWYEEACEWVKAKGIADGTRPEETATRAEIFTMLKRLYELK